MKSLSQLHWRLSVSLRGLKPARVCLAAYPSWLAVPDLTLGERNAGSWCPSIVRRCGLKSMTHTQERNAELLLCTFIILSLNFSMEELIQCVSKRSLRTLSSPRYFEGKCALIRDTIPGSGDSLTAQPRMLSAAGCCAPVTSSGVGGCQC